MRVSRSGVAAAVAAVAAVALCACGDDSTDEDAGTALGAAVATAQDSSTSSAPPGEGSTGEAPAGEGGSAADQPPEPSPSTDCVDPEGTPTIPSDASPPTTIPGSEPSDIPSSVLSDQTLPQFGALVVDVGPQGCIDIATRFRTGQRVLMYTHADDGKFTHIEVFGPDGSSLGEWDTGEPETLEGWDFFNDTPLPADGVYVFRITHVRGSDDPFMIAFYGDA